MCTWIRRNLKETFLWSINTCPELGKQNIQAKEVYCWSNLWRWRQDSKPGHNNRSQASAHTTGHRCSLLIPFSPPPDLISLFYITTDAKASRKPCIPEPEPFSISHVKSKAWALDIPGYRLRKTQLVSRMPVHTMPAMVSVGRKLRYEGRETTASYRPLLWLSRCPAPWTNKLTFNM